MTTAQSPLRVLKAQAGQMAAALKAAERGEVIATDLGRSVGAARAKESITFAVVMDDKVIKITMAWATIKATSEVGLAEYILKQMRGSRDATH